MHRKLSGARPLVGSIGQWRGDYDEYVNRRKHMSRYLDEGDTEKVNLEISKEKFVPNAYMQFINGSGVEEN